MMKHLLMILILTMLPFCKAPRVDPFSDIHATCKENHDAMCFCISQSWQAGRDNMWTMSCDQAYEMGFSIVQKSAR